MTVSTFRPMDIPQFIDLTSLSGDESDSELKTLCERAQKYKTASICVYPKFAEFCLAYAQDLRICVVGDNFPGGVTHADTKKAIELGVHEVDIVIDLDKVKASNMSGVQKDIENVKELCLKKNTLLKVILETCELNHYQISELSKISIDAGADFIKTSTGKRSGGASMEAVQLMCEVIKKSGKKIGIKPSGGVRTYGDSLRYLDIVETILGPSWLTPKLFRIGASSLLDEVINYES